MLSDWKVKEQFGEGQKRDSVFDFFNMRFAFCYITLPAVLLILFSIFSSQQADAATIDRKDAWVYIEKQARKANLDPYFVYAIAFAESSLKSNALNSNARGMMQLKKIAWDTVSKKSYDWAWDWQTNVDVGIAYLAYCKKFLQKNSKFSYPLLAATYRFGPTHVKKNRFSIYRLERPTNKVYAALFQGAIQHVPFPQFGRARL